MDYSCYMIFLQMFSISTSFALDDIYAYQINDTTENLPISANLVRKDESLFECELFQLDKDEFVMYPNGTAYVPAYNTTYNESFYLVVDDFLRVCIPPPPEDEAEVVERLTSTPIMYLSIIAVGISMVCLLAHLVVFSFVPDLQNLPGYNLASLCTSLFFSYLFMIIGQSVQETGYSSICITAGVLTHYFFLASFLWMLVMSFDVLRSILLATGSLRISSKEFKVKKFVTYSIFSWFTASAFTAAAVFADNVEGVPRAYRPMFYESCWFENKSSLLAFFAIPISVITSGNFIMFGLSAYSIFSNRMKSAEESQRSNLRKSNLLYFRLSVIMGVTWITGVIAPIANVIWMWYVFSALNALQGLFIFLAFTCSPKVKKYFKAKLCSVRRASETTLSPTFQSYCYYANSIEKDLDKVVDSKDKNGVIDTIVIHL